MTRLQRITRISVKKKISSISSDFVRRKPIINYGSYQDVLWKKRCECSSVLC